MLGVDDAGREVLSYLPGDAVTAPAPGWGLTDAALRSVGQLLRRFHDAAAGFDPTPYAWSHVAPAPYHVGGISHNDPNLDNVVFRDGHAKGLIDFDLAAPGDPLWDVASAARLWVPLRSPCDIDDVRRGRGLARVRAFVDAYGLDDAGRTGLVAGGARQPRLDGRHRAGGRRERGAGVRGLLGAGRRRPRPSHRRLAGAQHRHPDRRPALSGRIVPRIRQ